MMAERATQPITEGSEAREKVPIEIWQKIFGYLNENQKEVVKAREVCRFWRNVIDDNIEFKVLLHDENPTWNKMSHVRVNSCRVHNFKIPIPPNLQLYRDLNLLTKLHLYNGISRQNFIWLLEQSPNLKYFKLRGCVLSEDSLLMGTNPQEQLVLKNFFNNLKSIEFGNSHVDENYMSIWIANFTKLMTTSMPSLTSIGFKIQFANMLPWFVGFLLLNSSLKDVDFGLQNTYSLPRELHEPEPINMEDLKNIQLRSIKVSVMDLSEYGMQLIFTILKAQRSLVHLDICESPTLSIRDHTFYFNDLTEMMSNNYSTLTTIVFFCVQLTSDLDATIFDKFTGLKTLALYRQESSDSKAVYQIKNLVCLPQSLEKLNIEGLNFDENDLKALLTSDSLVNVRFVKLVGTKKYRFTSEHVENLTTKKSLVYLKLGPVLIDDFQVEIENQEKIVRLSNGFKLRVFQANWLNKKFVILEWFL